MRIFDTTFLIDLVNGDSGAVKKAREIDAQQSFKAISTMTVHEYLRGIYYLYAYDREKLRSKLNVAESELARFEILPYVYEIAKISAQIDATLATQGQIISITDTIIAATAQHYNLTLVTRNSEHFQRIERLRIETY